jgi:hypothetical protein
MEVPHGCAPFGRAFPAPARIKSAKEVIPGKGAPEGRTSVNMQHRELYRRILGIEAPWQVERVELKLETGEVYIYLDHAADVTWSCLECSAPSPLYDHQPERCWRHLDTCQNRTIWHANPPRIHQRQDSVGEIYRSRISQRTELHQRDLFPL